MSQTYTFTFFKKGGFDGTHFDHKLYVNLNGVYVLRKKIKNIPGESLSSYKFIFHSNQAYYKVNEDNWHVRGEKLTGTQAYSFLVENTPISSDTPSYEISQKAGANPKIVKPKQSNEQTPISGSTGGTSGDSTQQGLVAQPAGQGQPDEIQPAGQGQPAQSVGQGQPDEIQPAGQGQPAQPAGQGQPDEIQPAGQGQPAQSEGQGGQSDEIQSSGQDNPTPIYTGHIAWQNLTAKEIWAKIKNFSIDTWKHMTYDELKAKAKEARAKWSKKPREWDLNKQRAVNNAWGQQIRIKNTANEAKEARDYAKKAHTLYGLSTPTFLDYAPSAGLPSDSYTPIPIIKNIQVITAPDSTGPLVAYNWDNSLKHLPSGKGLRFYNRAFYLNKSGNWVPVFSDGRGVLSSNLPSFITAETIASGESSWFRINPKNTTGEYSVKFYFQLGGAGPTSESEVVFEFDSSGNMTSRSVNSK